LSRCEAEFQNQDWLTSVLNFREDVLNPKKPPPASDISPDIAWFREQTRLRVRKVHELVEAYMPWKLPDFAALRNELESGGAIIDDVPLQQLPDLILDLERRLGHTLRSVRNGIGTAGERLLLMLAEALQNTLRLTEHLRQTSDQSSSLANAMDFTFLLDRQRLLLTVGFDTQSEERQPYC
jgi:hypothetical protein